MKINGWKVAAIILGTFFVLQILLFIGLYNIGAAAIEKENECMYNICTEADTYYYDSYEGVCYCYKDNEVIYQKYIGG